MKKILVLEGGFNEEHEISLNTSKEVQRSLERMKFKFEVLQVNPENFSEKIVFYDDDVLCFNALHGTYGEDGTIQKILENNKITYTHSDSKVSKITLALAVLVASPQPTIPLSVVILIIISETPLRYIRELLSINLYGTETG